MRAQHTALPAKCNSPVNTPLAYSLALCTNPLKPLNIDRKIYKG